jgi:hypothetical protein
MTPITAAALCVHACGTELQVAAVAVDSRPCCALVVLPPDPADAAPSVCNGGRLQSLLSSHKQLLGHLLMRHSIIIQASCNVQVNLLRTYLNLRQVRRTIHSCAGRAVVVCWQCARGAVHGLTYYLVGLVVQLQVVPRILLAQLCCTIVAACRHVRNSCNMLPAVAVGATAF